MCTGECVGFVYGGGGAVRKRGGKSAPTSHCLTDLYSLAGALYCTPLSSLLLCDLSLSPCCPVKNMQECLLGTALSFVERSR